MNIMKRILPATKATVSSRGQLVIPKEIRDACGIVTGTEILIRTREDGVIELKALKRNVTDLFKNRGAPEGPPTVIDEAIAAAIAENDVRTRSVKGGL